MIAPNAKNDPLMLKVEDVVTIWDKQPNAPKLRGCL